MDRYSQNIMFTSSGLNAEREYWLEKLVGEIETSGFPYDSSIALQDSCRKDFTCCTLPEEVSKKLDAISGGSPYALFVVLLSGVMYLLHKYNNNSEDILAGMPVFKQTSEREYFNNILLLRSSVKGNGTFKELLAEIKTTVTEADRNQNMPFGKIIEIKGNEFKSSSRSNLNTLVLLDNIHESQKTEETMADTVFLFRWEDGNIGFKLEYDSLLYEKQTIEAIARQLTEFYRSVADHPGIQLSEIEIVTGEEKELIFSTFNRTRTEYPKYKTIQELFEEQADRVSGKAAFVMDGQALTYRELDERANQVADYLTQVHGIRPDSLVGVMMEKSAHLIAAVLGILKAGGAYLPMDPGYPEERIRTLINDSGIGIVIAGKSSMSVLNKLQWECKHFHTYLCMDSGNIYSELEIEKNELMDKKLWEYVGNNAATDIEGGGWVSSYTGENLTEEDMQEYSHNILQKLMPYLDKNVRVLEVGCSSGLSMFKIAPYVGFYCGTDMSEIIIQKCQDRISRDKMDHIKVSCLAAHQIDSLEEDGFDIVIMNSVVQCFHGYNYLRDVLSKAVKLLKRKGLLFIGDIMDQDLKYDMIKDLENFKKSNIHPGCRTKTDWSNELFLSRGFFEDLKAEMKEMVEITFSKKIFTLQNELSMFRFDALIEIDKDHHGELTDTKRHKYQQDMKVLQQYRTGRVQRDCKQDNLAYVMYTSGSTGKSKGVMVEHRNVVRLVKNTNYIEFLQDDCILQTGAIAFDASTFEIWGALLNGLTLYMADEGVVLNAEKLKDTIERHRITTMWLTAPLFNQLSQEKPDAFSGLRNLLVGGDVLSPKHINRVRKMCPNTRVVNGYGPTENTTFSTCFSIDREYERNIPIGKPVSNSTVYILDKYRNLQPVGMPGELWVGGDGVARGYFNDKESTKEKFVENPSFIASNTPGGRIYKTGDLARWLPDGNIEFMGRADRQVKIRGFRIELDEIEQMLVKNEWVKEAAVSARVDKSGDRSICAYFVCRDRLLIADLREYLARELPDYALPSYFVPLEALPKTSTGKVDRKNLPDPFELIRTETQYEAPGNEIEEKLVKIWREVLGVERIGVNDNFFELGGHSLKATILISKIHKVFNTDVPLSKVFSLQTVRRLSRYIEEAEENTFHSVLPVEENPFYLSGSYPKGCYPLSSAQKRLYILDQLEGVGVSYNIPGAVILEGELDRTHLLEVFKSLIKRHETLRTSFEFMNGEPVQRVHENIEFSIEFTEDENAGEPEDIKEKVCRFIKPFDLSKAPLFRIGLLKFGDVEGKRRHVLMYDMHHIISDGTSIGILIKEFSERYHGHQRSELKIQYKDYAAWQQAGISQLPVPGKGLFRKQEQYWLNNFQDQIPVLDLPCDYKRPSVQSFEGGRVCFKIDKGTAGRLNEIAKENHATLYMVLLAAYNILLSRYSGQEDIVVGSPIAGRFHSDLQGVIGMFVNTLAMRNKPQGSKTFTEFLEEVKENSLRVYENQDYQFEELVERLNIKRDLSRNPVFDTLFALQNMDLGALEIQNLKIMPFEIDNTMSKFDLSLMAYEEDGGIQGILEYCTKLFKRETIQRMAIHFENIVKGIAKNTDTVICDIDILEEGEKKRILLDFNCTEVDFPRTKRVHELFEEQAEAEPFATALVFNRTELYYGELNRRAGLISAVLQQKGAGRGSVIALMTGRSLFMVEGILGILKAGAAYLPIDPEYPPERIGYILKDSGTDLVVADTIYESLSSFHAEKVILLSEELYTGCCTIPAQSGLPEDPAYVIYTSGSTGNPKGVVIPHSAVCNFFEGMASKIDFSKGKSVLALTTLCFDISVLEILLPLAKGLKVVIADEECQENPKRLKELLLREKVQILQMTPSRLKAMLSEDGIRGMEYVSELLVGGEAFPDNLYELLSGLKNTRVYNMYGPTETTVWSCVKELVNAHEITIGQPIANTRVYILDKYLKPVPQGAAGELYIAGEGVAKGYLHKETLTAERFLPDPYSNGRMYKTGDLAGWRENGEIEFLGRTDFQVKIRGYRIEPGEIETRLLKCDGVKQVLVADRMDESGNNYLCAYLVKEGDLDIKDLRESLKKELPDYMVPSYFVKLDELPLTPNGKINRNALPEPSKRVHTGALYSAPGCETEEKLIDLWKQILGVDPIGIDDNFFDVGGHSLRATLLISKVYRAWGVEMPLKQVFKTPTVRQLAEYIDHAEKKIYVPLKPANAIQYPGGLFPLSSAQKRLYIIEQHGGTGISYNMPGMVSITGSLDLKRVEYAAAMLVRRHEALRTSFELLKGEPVQKIHDTVEFAIELTDLSSREKSIDYEWMTQKVNEIAESFIRPFDLSCAPLLRSGLIKLSPVKHIWMFDMHHIISDGTSLNIIVKEFAALYAGKELPEPGLQYKDFALWQNSLFEKGLIQKQEEYWLNRFAGKTPVLDLPSDYKRPLVKSFEGDRVNFTVDARLTKALQTLAGETGTTLYMIMLAAYSVLLSLYSGQKDIVVGTGTAGRGHADLENVVGMFVNSLAMRNTVDSEKAFSAFLEEVRENAVEAYENQDYQFEMLVEKLDLTRDMSRHPLFDVSFILQNMDTPEVEMGSLQFEPYRYDFNISKFDLSLYASEREGMIYCSLEFCTALFKKDTVIELAKCFEKLIRAVTEDRDIKIRDIQLLDPQLKEKLTRGIQDAVDFSDQLEKDFDSLFGL